MKVKDRGFKLYTQTVNKQENQGIYSGQEVNMVPTAV